MAKQIKFEGKIHSFPDDASEDEINEALGGVPSSPSVSQDIMNLPNLAGNAIEAAPEEIKGAIHQSLGRSLKNVASGYLGLANLPHLGAEYAASRHIPGLQELIKHAPLKYNLDPNEALGLGEQQPGDIAWQSIGPGGLLKNLTKGLRKSAIGATKSAVSHIPEITSKIGDIAPILKSTASRPYKKQIEVLEKKGLTTGYKPNVNDVLESSRILTSPGMTIPHEAVHEAVGQTLKGNFKPWFALQSSVRSEGRRLSKKGGVNHTLGQKLYDLAEKMHEEMGAAQTARGAPEAEALMRQGKARTARHHKISPIAKTTAGIAFASALPKWAGQLFKATQK